MLLALLLDCAFERPRYQKTGEIALLLVMAALQWAGILYHVHQNTDTKRYLTTAQFILQNSSPASFHYRARRLLLDCLGQTIVCERYAAWLFYRKAR
jgi:hypothetical protein